MHALVEPHAERERERDRERARPGLAARSVGVHVLEHRLDDQLGAAVLLEERDALDDSLADLLCRVCNRVRREYTRGESRQGTALVAFLLLVGL